MIDGVPAVPARTDEVIRGRNDPARGRVDELRGLIRAAQKLVLTLMADAKDDSAVAETRKPASTPWLL
jgi:hypothetical protein